MSGNIYAVLGETELEIIAWLDGLDMRFAAHYAEQALIGRKGLLQHTGFAPDEVKMRVLLHAQWCQPAEELARLKRILDDTEPVAFVLGSGEYRGVFVVTDLDVTSTQTDGAGVAIAFEAEVQLKEYIGDPALPEPPGVIAQGYRIPVGAVEDVAGTAAIDAPSGPFSGVASAVSQAVSAVGQVAAAVSEVRSLVSLAASNPLAAVSLVAGRAGGLLQAAGALPVAAFEALSGVAAVGFSQHLAPRTEQIVHLQSIPFEQTRFQRFVRLQMSVGMDMPYRRPGLGHASCDENAAMAVERVFFGAHQADAVLFHSLTQTLQSL